MNIVYHGFQLDKTSTASTTNLNPQLRAGHRQDLFGRKAVESIQLEQTDIPEKVLIHFRKNLPDAYFALVAGQISIATH